MGSSQLRSNIDNILSKNWKIKIKYFDDATKLKKISKGNWIDGVTR